MGKIIDIQTRETTHEDKPCPHKVGHAVVAERDGAQAIFALMGRKIIEGKPHFLAMLCRDDVMNEDENVGVGALIEPHEIVRNLSLELQL